MDNLTKKIKERAMVEFSEYLDKVIKSWDGESSMEVVIRYTLTPRIDTSMAEQRRIGFEGKGREDT